jgi:ZIP family zinc transporter
MLDGAIYTAVFWHDHDAGVFASLGLALHEAPEGVVALLLGLRTGLRPAGAIGVALLASTLTTPLGWALAHALEGAGEAVMRPMFAASAGLLLYVGWHLISDGLRGMRARRNQVRG